MDKDSQHAGYLAARRSKDGRHVLCVRPLPGGKTCGQRLALIRYFAPQLREVDGPFELREVDGPDAPIRFVDLPPGFVQGVDGVWQLSEGAKKRWAEDRARAAGYGDRRAASRLSADRAMHNRRPVGSDTHGRQGQVPWPGTGWDRDTLQRTETLMRCPACSMVNHLTAPLLDCV